MANFYETDLEKGIARITLPCGRITIVDSEDTEILQRFRWSAVTPGPGRDPYVRAGSTAGGKRISLHRLLSGAKPGEVVDHVNGNTLDNRKSNLRVTTTRDNAQNTLKGHGVAGVRGVTRTSSGRYAARLFERQADGSVSAHALGTFKTPAEAFRSFADEAARRWPLFPAAAAQELLAKMEASNG